MGAENAIQEGLPASEAVLPRMPLRWPRGATWITWVCASVCLCIGVDLMQMFAEFDKALAVAQIRAGGVGIDRYLHAHRLSTVLAVILLTLIIPAGAIALRWLHITYRNLFGLQVQGLTETPTGAIKRFFLPTSWLHMPYRLVQEIWLASNPALPSASNAWQTQPGSWLIRVWWLLFLLGFLRISVSIKPFPADNPALLALLEAAAWCTVVSAGLGAAAGILFIVIVLAIERRQWQRYDRLPA